jgi:flagellar motor switch protein FliM
MAEFLSQDEIDALLDIAEEGGEDDLESSDIGHSDELLGPSTEKNYIIYDFKKPNRVSTEQFRSFQNLHEKMLRDFASDISAQLRKIVDVKIYSVEQMTFGEFILSIPQITSIITASLKPLEGRVVVECNPSISHNIISKLLGGGSKAINDQIDRELTEIEIEIFDHFYQLLVKHMNKVWQEISNINFKVESHDTNANAIQVSSDHDIVLLVVMEMTIDDESGFLSLCYPINYIEPLLEKIVRQSLTTNKAKSRNKDIKAIIQGSTMDIESIMAETELTAEEILNLQNGDVIMFNKSASSHSTKLLINNKEKFLAISGESNNRKAIQIVARTGVEKTETLNLLREMKEQRLQYQQNATDKIKQLSKVFHEA